MLDGVMLAAPRVFIVKKSPMYQYLSAGTKGFTGKKKRSEAD